MTDVTDVALWYLILGGYVVHQGGLKAAWEDFSDRFIAIGEKAWAEMLRKEKGSS